MSADPVNSVKQPSWNTFRRSPVHPSDFPALWLPQPHLPALYFRTFHPSVFPALNLPALPLPAVRFPSLCLPASRSQAWVACIHCHCSKACVILPLPETVRQPDRQLSTLSRKTGARGWDFNRVWEGALLWLYSLSNQCSPNWCFTLNINTANRFMLSHQANCI